MCIHAQHRGRITKCVHVYACVYNVVIAVVHVGRGNYRFPFPFFSFLFLPLPSGFLSPLLFPPSYFPPPISPLPSFPSAFHPVFLSYCRFPLSLPASIASCIYTPSRTHACMHVFPHAHVSHAVRSYCEVRISNIQYMCHMHIYRIMRCYHAHAFSFSFPSCLPACLPAPASMLVTPPPPSASHLPSLSL